MNEEPHRHSFAANSELRAEMKSAILDLMQVGPDDDVADLGDQATGSTQWSLRNERRPFTPSMSMRWPLPARTWTGQALSRFRHISALTSRYRQLLDTPFGPPKHMRLAKEEFKKLVEAHSFRQKDEREFDYHYALTFERL